MSTAAKERNKRSWTDQREQSANRMGAMVFLGLAAVSLFLFFVWYYFFGRLPAQSFAAILSINKYESEVPDIRVGTWGLDEMTKIDGLFPWEKPFNTTFKNNEKDVIQFFSDLKGLKEMDKQKDTAIIQLRCHAAVTKTDSESWHCGLYINDESDSDKSKSYRFADFLDLAASVPAKNIVVFAEIADLQFEPHLGWVANPIEYYIRKACKGVNEKLESGQKVWIVCSNADFQSPLFSAKRGKTLFQEACEESLKAEAVRNGRGDHLTLARYFELIYRYCHTASRGRQTPKLILASKSDDELPLQAADDVFIGNFKKVAALPKSIDKKSLKDKGNATDSTEGRPSEKEARNRTGKKAVLVSYRQTEGKAPQDPKSVKAVEKEPRLLFWQIRDDIEARGTDNNLWSPRDFAPFAWRKLQADVAKESIWSDESESVLADRAKAMEMLRDSLASGSPAPLDDRKKGDHWNIVAAWNNFVASDSSFRSFRRQWQNASTGIVDSTTGLLGPEIENWRKQRKEFRSYIDCLAELSSWIELAAEFASADFPEDQAKQLNDDCKEFIFSLLEQNKWIPRSHTESAFEQSKSLQMAKSLGIRNLLYEHIKKAIRNSNLEDKKEEFTWQQERKYQVLLSSPLLQYEQRAQLVKAMKDREPKKVVPKTDAAFETIQPPNPVVQLSELKKRCEMLRYSWPLFSAWPLFSDKEALPQVPQELEELLAWGRGYHDEIGSFEIRKASVDREDAHQSVAAWHFLSLVDPRFALKLHQETQPDKSWAGIVVPPIAPKTIRLSMASQTLDFPEGKNDVPLRIKVEHFDGTEVSSCQLKWTSESEVRDFSVKQGSQTVEKGQSITVRPSGKQIDLNCALRSTDPPESGTQILVSAMSSTSKDVSNQLVIPVFRNAERIDLVIRRVGEPVPLKAKKGNADSKESAIELDSPAITGATSEFRFSISNKMKMARSVGLKISVAPTTPLGKADANLVAIGEFETELPPMQETSITLKPIESLNNLDALNSMLIFEIVEYEILDPKKEAAKKKEKGGRWRYSARFKPVHPRNFVKAIPQPVEANSRYSIEFETSPEFWRRHELKEMPILVRGKTIIKGELSPEKVLQPPMIFNADNSKSEFIGSAVNTNTQRFLTDIGGYPRAFVFDAFPVLPKMERVDEDQARIVEFRPILKELKTVVGEKQNTNGPLKKFGEYIVFPWLQDGVQVAYRAIEIETVIDKAANSPISYEILKLEGNEEKKTIDRRTIFEDRSYSMNLRIREDGVFNLGYVPSELKIRHVEGIESFDGTYIFRVQVGEQKAEQKFIFDKTKPPSSFVDAETASEAKSASNDNSKKSITLFKGDKVDMRVDAVDTAGEGSIGSGLDNAIFKLCGRSPMTFDEATEPALLGVVTASEGRVSIKLDATAFLEKPKGQYWVTVKTIDRAGNFQIQNQPLRVDWTNVERPAPPKKPSEKPPQ